MDSGIKGWMPSRPLQVGEEERPDAVLPHLTLITQCVIIPRMIKTFRDQDTESLFARQVARKFPAALQKVAWRKLAILDAVESLEDLRTTG